MMQQFWIRVAAMEGFPYGASGKESSGNEPQNQIGGSALCKTIVQKQD